MKKFVKYGEKSKLDKENIREFLPRNDKSREVRKEKNSKEAESNNNI